MRTGVEAAAVDLAGAMAAERLEVLGRARSPCARRSRTADSARAAPPSRRRVPSWRGSRRPRSACGARRRRRTPRRHSRARAGRRLPSIQRLLRTARRAPRTARRMASIVACRMLRRSISSTLARATAQAMARSLMRAGEHLAPLGVSTLESARPLMRRAGRGSPRRRTPGRRAGRARPRRPRKRAR